MTAERNSAPASGMPHTPTQEAGAHRYDECGVVGCSACAERGRVERPEMPRPPAEINGDGLAAPDRGTGVREAEKPAQAADDTWFADVAASVKPVHYREAAADLRKAADAWEADLLPFAPNIAFVNGINWAADRLESYARDLSDPGEGR